MSGVKNLRAMFEQRGGESNPPDRGRSPGPGRSFASPSPSDSPRPLSKVRTSFVAVEKDGRIGLKREHSGDSVSVSSRRFSNDTEATTPQPLSEKSDVFAENMAKNASAFKSNLANESIPESPRQDAPPKLSPHGDPNTPEVVPSQNPDKFTDEEEPRTKMIPGNPTEKASTRGSHLPTSAGLGDVFDGPSTASPKTKALGTTKPAAKAVPISTTGKSETKAPKSPMATKAPTKESVRASGQATTKKPAPQSSKEHDTPKKMASSKSTVTSGKKPAAMDLAPSSTGFVKPKVKSPTRPVKLPAGLTTHTASSASKAGNGGAAPAPRQSLSRASGNAQHLGVSNPATHRSPSRNSASTTSTSTGASKPLKRQSSTISRSRPSLGPPPKQTARDHPVAKKEGSQIDDSFLARMMRPTQSSASKTAERTSVTPPRSQNPATTAHIKKTVPKDIEGSAKKAAAKIQSSGSKASEAAKETATDVSKTVKEQHPQKQQQHTAKETDPSVAQAESADQVIEAAKASTETAATPLVEKAEAEKATQQSESNPTAKDIAPIVAQEATAEAAIETAKTSTDTAASPVVEKCESQPEVIAEPVDDVAEEEAATPELVDEQTVPTILAEDPEKVEDIEDLVQEKPVEQLVGGKIIEPEPSPVNGEPAPVGDENVPKLEEIKLEEAQAQGYQPTTEDAVPKPEIALSKADGLLGAGEAIPTGDVDGGAKMGEGSA